MAIDVDAYGLETAFESLKRSGMFVDTLKDYSRWFASHHPESELSEAALKVAKFARQGMINDVEAIVEWLKTNS